MCTEWIVDVPDVLTLYTCGGWMIYKKIISENRDGPVREQVNGFEKRI